MIILAPMLPMLVFLAWMLVVHHLTNAVERNAIEEEAVSQQIMASLPEKQG